MDEPFQRSPAGSNLNVRVFEFSSEAFMGEVKAEKNTILLRDECCMNLERFYQPFSCFQALNVLVMLV
jgi:hypothetical protein